MDIIEGLNEQQREAVLHRDGPCLVLAGAGSGKTRVLTGRIGQLIQGGVAPHQILAITFTNKAAGEMRERVQNLIPACSGYWIQTFHAACYRILRMDIEKLDYPTNFTIMDDGDSRALLKSILKEERDYHSKPEAVLYGIKQAKNSLQDPEKYFSSQAGSYESKEKALRYINCTTPV